MDFCAHTKNTTWTMNLEECVINVYERKDDETNYDSSIIRTEELRIKDKKVEFFNDKFDWRPCRRQIQRAYLDYIAEKELLGVK